MASRLGLRSVALGYLTLLLGVPVGLVLYRTFEHGLAAPINSLTSADGALFTPFSTDQAIVLNLKDGKTANTLPLGEENSSSAAPVSVNKLVLITTPHGLLAFSSANRK